MADPSSAFSDRIRQRRGQGFEVVTIDEVRRWARLRNGERQARQPWWWWMRRSQGARVTVREVWIDEQGQLRDEVVQFNGRSRKDAARADLPPREWATA